MKLKLALLSGTVVAALALAGATQAQPYNGSMNGGMRNGMSNEMQGRMQERGSYSGNEDRGLSPRDVRQFMHTAQRTLIQGIRAGNMQQLRQWTQRSIANDAVFSGNRSMQSHGITKSISAMTFNKQDLLALESLGSGSGNGPGMLGLLRNYDVSIHVLNMRPVGEGAAMVRVRISQSRTLGGNNEESQSGQSGDEQSQNWQQQQQQQQQSDASTTGALASAGANQSGQSGSGQGSASDETVGQGGGGQEYGQGYGQQQNWSGGGSGGVQLRTDATCDYLLERNQNSGQVQIAMGICSGKTQTPF